MSTTDDVEVAGVTQLRVRADRDFAANYGHQLYTHRQGEVIDDPDHAAYLLDSGAPVSEMDDDTSPMPAPWTNAPKADWVTYAVSQGLDRMEAEALTKAALIELTTR